MESVWARMQVELLDRQRWRTRIELANAIFEYLEIFHNRQRRHTAIGMRTPIEYERNHYNMCDRLGVLAVEHPHGPHRHRLAIYPLTRTETLIAPGADKHAPLGQRRDRQRVEGILGNISEPTGLRERHTPWHNFVTAEIRCFIR